MLRFLILVGYFELMMQLQLSGKIDQYINRHYQYLVILSMIFALLLGVIQLIHWARSGKKTTEPEGLHHHDEEHHHHHHSSNQYSAFLGILLLLFPLIVGFLFPTVNLNTTIVEAKGFQFPLSKESSGDSFMETQYLKPDTSIYFNKTDYDKEMQKELAEFKDQKEIVVTDENYLKVIELIYNFPSQFDGKKITFTGFVYLDPVEKEKHVFLFRFGIIHCIADSGVFGLLTHLPEETPTPNNNDWLSISGTIHTEYYAPFKREIPAATADEVKIIKAPEQQYVYRQF